jgi:hypothetical protein
MTFKEQFLFASFRLSMFVHLATVLQPVQLWRAWRLP